MTIYANFTIRSSFHYRWSDAWVSLNVCACAHTHTHTRAHMCMKVHFFFMHGSFTFFSPQHGPWTDCLCSIPSFTTDLLGGLGKVTYLLCVLLIVSISTVMVVRVSITGFVWGLTENVSTNICGRIGSKTPHRYQTPQRLSLLYKMT